MHPSPQITAIGHRRLCRLLAATFGRLFRFLACAAALGGALLLAACAPLPVKVASGPEGAPADFPASTYRTAMQRGDTVYAIDSARSLVTIVVRRGGTLARLGHDHVVASRDVHGFVDTIDHRADLYARLDRLTVDEPALRRDAHFDTQPSASDVAGTRINMLTRVLHVERHPFVEVAIRRDEGPAQVSITLNGVTRSIPVQLAIDERGSELEASGSFAIDQTDFGLQPMSLFNGAITVENRLELRFTIRAGRVTDRAATSAHKGSG